MTRFWQRVFAVGMALAFLEAVCADNLCWGNGELAPETLDVVSSPTIIILDQQELPPTERIEIEFPTRRRSTLRITVRDLRPNFATLAPPLELDVGELYAVGDVAPLSALPGDTNADGIVELDDLCCVQIRYRIGESLGSAGDGMSSGGVVNLARLFSVRNRLAARPRMATRSNAAQLLAGAMSMALLGAFVFIIRPSIHREHDPQVALGVVAPIVLIPEPASRQRGRYWAIPFRGYWLHGNWHVQSLLVDRRTKCRHSNVRALVAEARR
jgi:hypothetical protein